MAVTPRILKKVLEEEREEIEKELNEIFKKYNVKNIKELSSVADLNDYERAKTLEEKLNKIMKCIREINLKII